MIQGDQPFKPYTPTPAAIPAEQLASAIAQTLHVFEGEQAAGDALEYLKAVLDSAPGAAHLASSAQNCADDLRAAAAEGWSDLYRQAAEEALALVEHFSRSAATARAAHIDLARRHDKLEATNADLAAQLAAAQAAAVDAVAWPDIAEAIAQAREAFADEPGAARVISCITSLLASAPGGETARIAKETHAAAGAAPVVGTSQVWLRAMKSTGLLNELNLPETHMDAGVKPACTPTVISRLVVEVDSTQIDAALAKLAELEAAQRRAARAAMAAAMAKDAL